MLIPILATAIRLGWLLIEFPKLRRNRITVKQNWDKHSAKLWDVANGIELLGMVLGFVGIGHIQTAPRVIGLIGLLLLISGIAIRSIAIRTLGKFFTGTVVIKNDHQLIRTGLYNYLRHPAYTGTLLAHLGLGLAFANWFSLALSSVPFLLVAMYRMRVEERALAATFGAEYSSYCETSKRLIPGLY
jgi:protein-S-isoprenylcysteine O-methyltransferase Ste14